MALTRASAAVIKTEEIVNNRNRIINGDMRIDQRNAGASFTIPNTSAHYTLDRYQARFNNGSGHTVQQVTDAPTGFIYSSKITIGTGATLIGTDFNRFIQNIEGYNINDLAYGSADAKTITVSFWVKSSVTGTYGVTIRNSTSNRIYVGEYVINTSGTWEYKIITIPGDTGVAQTQLTTGSGLVLAFDMGEGSDRSISAGSWQTTSTTSYGLTGGTKLVETSGATWQVTGVQLEVGSVATPFERRPFGTELSLCQRYFEKSFSMSYQIGSGSAATTRYGGSPTAGLAGTTGYILGSLAFIVPKRAAPTLVLYDAAGTANRVTAENPGASSTNDNSAYTAAINEFGGIVGRDGVAGTRTSVQSFSYNYTSSSEL